MVLTFEPIGEILGVTIPLEALTSTFENEISNF